MRVSSLLLVLVLGACKGSTEPSDPPFEVIIVPGVTITGLRTVDQAGVPIVRCNYQIDLTAKGGARASEATWTAGRVEWRRTGEEYDDPLSAAEMASVEWFGAAKLTSGTTVTARRYAYWDTPFTLNHVFMYKLPDGTSASSSYLLTCN